MDQKKFKYQCTTCGSEYGQDQFIYLCPACNRNQLPKQPPKGVLKVLYDYTALNSKRTGFEQLRRNGFLDILPIQKLTSLPNLKIGNTPLYCIRELNREKIPFGLYLKDDSQNPTYSYKDRASALVSAYAREHGFETIVAASTGNAGSSLAGICAAQGQKAIIMVPATAPAAKLTQIMMYGAFIVPVKGSYDDAFDLSIAASDQFGWYNRNTAYNPITVEGKKTVAFELFEELNFKVPDRIFIPVGDGVIISGVYKGFEDLMNLGIIDRIPTMVAVQAQGSDNLVRNIGNSIFEMKLSHTLADSISVNAPRNFYMAKRYLHEYQGEAITVTDEEILSASSLLASRTGLFTEPASAAAFAGMMKYRQQGRMEPGSLNVVLLTGSGLKDLKAVAGNHKLPEPVEPTLESIIKLRG